MQRVLVTGATGFVGSHVLEAGSKAPDIEWIAACRDPRKLVDGFHGKYRVGDLRDPVYCREVSQGVDVVVHCAAWTSLWGNRKNSHELFYQPSLQLLEQAARSGIKRFVFLSTTSAVGRGAHGDPYAAGVQPVFWPHLSNVVRIENRMRELASDAITMVNLRCGLFAGARYNLGLLPVLLPRLTTHLVPWVNAGHTSMPIVSGEDLGQAFVLAASAPALNGYRSFQITGPEAPTARQVIEFLHREYGYPTPHFSVPFPAAYRFAWLMEQLDAVVPWDPLVVRSIIHLLEETYPDNRPAQQELGYRPRVHWQAAIRTQLQEMQARQQEPMRLAVPLE
jgi:nucleoside-diphosphate-sugar epimerase